MKKKRQAKSEKLCSACQKSSKNDQVNKVPTIYTFW